jgi:flagellar protein FlgJ
MNHVKTKRIQDDTEAFKQILENAKNSGDNEKLSSACKQFESIYIKILMENMRKTVIDGGLVEKSHARETFEGMLDEEIAKEVSKGQGIGLAQIMYEQLSKNFGDEEDNS